MTSSVVRTSLLILLLALVAGAHGGSPVLAKADTGAVAPGFPTATARYIVQLADPPLATYDGSLPGLKATAPTATSGTLGGGLDIAAPAAVAYAGHLAMRQAAVEAALARVAPGTEALYHYRVALNGLTVRLTEDQAQAAAAVPGVTGVTREEPVVPLMDVSLDQVAAPAAWADPRVGGRADAGRGVRVAIIDSGITAAHPMFDDTGFTAPPGFPQATVTVGDQVWEYAPDQVAAFTNDKVIVARAYVNPELAGSGDPRTQVTPLADGLAGFHGAHVAGIAAGSVITGTAGDGVAEGLTLSGVAPGAYVMAYKFSQAYTPEILKAIDDAVADGAHVVNNSWGTSAMNVLDPERHPVAQAFKAATTAGVVVVGAAGNAGSNGEATLGGPHLMIDEVITVANVQGPRYYGSRLTAADEGLPARLESHRAVYWDVSPEFEAFEAPAYTGDLCNPLAAIAARDKVAFVPIDQQCAGSIPLLPIELPPPAMQIIIAQTVGAKAVVLWSPTGEPTDTPMLLRIVFMALPLLQEGFEAPITGMIAGPEAADLVAWAAGHPTTTVTLDPTVERVIDPTRSDTAHSTSSRGPGPGPGAPLKPDLSAPGSDVLSAATDAEGAPAGYAMASGTSMASPHVAGAAAVVRQAWPEWTPADVKAALVTTTDPVVRVSGGPAPVTVGGAGRLNVGRAVDPGALVLPSSLHLGRMASGTVELTLTVRDVRLEAPEDAVYLVRHEPGPGNAVVAPELPGAVTVPAGGQAAIDVRFTLAEPPPGDYDGRIVLADDTRRVHVAYAVRVPAERKDVLLVNVVTSAGGGDETLPIPMPGQFEELTDYAAFWTDALTEAGLEHDVWTVAAGQRPGTPPLSVLERYDLVIVAGGDGNVPLDQLPGGMTAFQMYLLGGGRLLANGASWPHTAPITQQLELQASGATYFLSRYFAGFELTVDDVALAADTALSPVRLFDLPVALSTGGSGAADNGGTVDVGRPLAELDTQGGPTSLPPDLGLAAPLVVDRIMPYMRSYLELGGQGSVMTGVTADATLEHPVAADDIPWRALFAGFPIEAIRTTDGRLSRAALLGRVHEWAVEPADFTASLAGPATGQTYAALTFHADGTSDSGVLATSWRWDAGDGRPFWRTPNPSATVVYDAPGEYTVRVEVTTAGGHTYVAALDLEVSGDGRARIFLPLSTTR